MCYTRQVLSGMWLDSICLDTKRRLKGKEQLMLLVVEPSLVLMANKGIELMASYIHFYNLGLMAILKQCLLHHLPGRLPEWPCQLSEGP